MGIEEKLETYRLLKKQLAEVKADEMSLRLELVEELAEGLGKGTHLLCGHEGLKVKVTKKLTYNIDEVILDSLPLTDAERECIRWKPSLVMKEFNSTETPNLMEAILVKDAAPVLIVELV